MCLMIIKPFQKATLKQTTFFYFSNINLMDGQSYVTTMKGENWLRQIHETSIKNKRLKKGVDQGQHICSLKLP